MRLTGPPTGEVNASMADYYPLLERAVASLPESTPESRRALYDRARKALLGQLRNIQPPIADADFDRESAALDESIGKIEAEFAEKAAAEILAARPEPASPLQTPPVQPGRAVPPRPGISAPISRAPFVRPSRTGAPAPPTTPVAPPVTPDEGDATQYRDTDADRLGDRLKRFGRPRDEELPDIGEADGDKSDAPEPVEGEADRRTLLRPVPPSPDRTQGSFKRPAILGAIVLAVVVGVSLLAIKLKDNPEDYVRARTPVSTAESENTAGKIADRVGAPAVRPGAPGTSGTNAARPQTTPDPAIPIAHRAAILVDAPDEPQKVKTYIGTVVWRVDPAAGPLPVLVAEIDIREANTKVLVRIARNLDPKLPASNTMDVQFVNGPNSPIPGVKAIDTPQMRIEDRATGDAMNAIPAPIMQNYFIVGLSNGDAAVARNLDLLKNRAWFDIPMLLTNEHFARLTFEKGTSGERAMAQVMQSWRQ